MRTTVFIGALLALGMAQPAISMPATGGAAGHLAAVGADFLEARVPQPKIRVPGPRSATMEGPETVTGNVILAQAGDPRVTQLEDQVRQLNGLVEELNFQILQMQEQLRKMQEDNEFRFQELEQRRSDAGGASGGEQNVARGDQIEELTETPQGTLTAPPAAGVDQSTSPRLGEPPRTFGRIIFDAQGNPVGAGAGDPPQVSQAPPAAGLPGVQTGPAPADNTTVAALPSGGDADTLYRDSYQFVLSGDYATAEAGFRQLLENHPGDQRAVDAQFWLGESLLAQGKHREAAQTFLAANRDHPEAPKAAETMLKLGISLAAMNQRDVACATFAEVPRRYPDASSTVVERARQEQAKASC